jgi:hypothetical protein
MEINKVGLNKEIKKSNMNKDIQEQEMLAMREKLKIITEQEEAT